MYFKIFYRKNRTLFYTLSIINKGFANQTNLHVQLKLFFAVVTNFNQKGNFKIKQKLIFLKL